MTSCRGPSSERSAGATRRSCTAGLMKGKPPADLGADLTDRTLLTCRAAGVRADRNDRALLTKRERTLEAFVRIKDRALPT